MQVINHQQVNYKLLKDSSTIYRGTIIMTKKEYQDMWLYFQNQFIAPMIPTLYKSFGLGVTATEMIFERYNLPRYKKQNYLIKVIR